MNEREEVIHLDYNSDDEYDIPESIDNEESDDDSDDERATGASEAKLMEYLMKGLVLQSNTCSVCDTPLIKSVVADENPIPLHSNSQIQPIGNVPFCVACNAHYVSSQDELKILWKDEYKAVMAMKGAVLLFMDDEHQHQQEPVFGKASSDGDDEEEEEDDEQGSDDDYDDEKKDLKVDSYVKIEESKDDEAPHFSGSEEENETEVNVDPAEDEYQYRPSSANSYTRPSSANSLARSSSDSSQNPAPPAPQASPAPPVKSASSRSIGSVMLTEEDQEAMRNYELIPYEKRYVETYVMGLQT